jgi:TATA-binding protein-associated factor
LNDLPPKIIQDYYCDLSDLQKQLYDAYASSQAKLSAEVAVQKGESAPESTGQKHVFQSLQYLRKICNHPALVLKDAAAIESLRAPDTGVVNVRDVKHAPKLEALRWDHSLCGELLFTHRLHRQLLTDCGVGSVPTDSKDQDANLDAAESTISQHRVLIFCQMKQMLDIIETDLFRPLMPSVTYMRLDGTTDANKRHAIVETFNADPSIDCLLLTTHVGGLGLTLTGADTVIFVEHDWNPMKDLQAMDRAHRLGQKKVVNVYRLITKGTLEEKIMGYIFTLPSLIRSVPWPCCFASLQRFKLNIANSVITQQNSGLASMDTDLVLDLFKRTTDEEDAAAKKKQTPEGRVTQKSVLEGLEDLPAEDEYNFDLSTFLGTLERPT